jgi:hypothetical protein
VSAEDRIRELERENALLREELWQQWQENHFEHCSRRWPHGENDPCMWPLPPILEIEPGRLALGGFDGGKDAGYLGDEGGQCD